MQTNVEIINRFYTAFQNLDAATMNSCYSEDIVFSDPVFGLLRGDEVRAMWEMLCKSAKDFSLTYSNVELLDDEYASCNWTATYIFSKTGKQVVNHIKAYMRLKDGMIIEHSDAFKLSKWAGQALGWKGSLFGWMKWFRKSIQKNARKSLLKFMNDRK